MEQKPNKERNEFIWRITSAHTIAYFFAGMFAVLFMSYKEHFGADAISVIMRPFDSPWIALGAGLQVFRGFITALVLLPFRNTFISKGGWIKLAVLILGLSYFATIGPTFGSFEGYLFTKVPLQYHLLGIPEALFYVFLFTMSLHLWYKKPVKAWQIVSIVLVSLIVLMSILGMLANLGIIKN